MSRCSRVTSFPPRSPIARPASPRCFLSAERPARLFVPGYNDSVPVPPQIGLRDLSSRQGPAASSSSGFAQRIPQPPATPPSAPLATPAAPCAIAHSTSRRRHSLPALSACFASPRELSAAPVSTRIAIQTEWKSPVRIPALDSRTSLAAPMRQGSPVWNQPALPASTIPPATRRLLLPGKSANSLSEVAVSTAPAQLPSPCVPRSLSALLHRAPPEDWLGLRKQSATPVPPSTSESISVWPHRAAGWDARAIPYPAGFSCPRIACFFPAIVSTPRLPTAGWRYIPARFQLLPSRGSCRVSIFPTLPANDLCGLQVRPSSASSAPSLSPESKCPA